LLALAVVTGIQAVGVILTTSLLVTPAAAASLLTRRLPVLLGLSAVVGTTSCVTGLYASYYLSISSGGAIVLTATGWFAVACVIRLWRERRSFPVAT
jgi:ABC-type Mn2+/Zn2+ transport system permease subunit